MLVIASVATVTVLLTVVLTTRQDAPGVAANGGRGIQARLSAESGIDLATAIMECDTIDWRTAHTNGILLDDYALGASTISIVVVDGKGQPPDADCEYCRVFSSGEVGGLEQIAEADVYAPKEVDSVDIDLSEFAIFGTQSLQIDNSIIGRWDQSPRAWRGEPVRVGTNATSSDAVRVNNNGHVIDAVAYVRGTAPTGVIDESGADARVPRRDITIADSIPVPDPPPFIELGILYDNPAERDITSDQAVSLSGARRLTSMTVRGGAMFATNYVGRNELVIDGDLRLTEAASWIINGHVSVVVHGDFIMDSDASIQLANEASTFRMLLEGSLSISQATLGTDPTYRGMFTDPLDASMPYRDPTNIRIYQHEDGRGAVWTISDKSLAVGDFYAPSNVVRIMTDTALFGRVLAAHVQMTGRSVVYYDHALDSRRGYTNPASPLFASDKTLDTILTSAITTLDPADQAVVNALLDLPSGIDNSSDENGVTPRSQPVASRLIRVGLDLEEATYSADATSDFETN